MLAQLLVLCKPLEYVRMAMTEAQQQEGMGMRTSMRLIPVVVVDVYNVNIIMSSVHRMTVLIFFLLNFLVWEYVNCPLFYTHSNNHIYIMYILFKYFCALYALIFFACNICS